MSNEPKALPRPCWFNNGTTEEPEWEPGTLYAWGNDSESDGNGVWHVPVGIVVDSSGRPRSVYLARISLAEESPDKEATN